LSRCHEAQAERQGALSVAYGEIKFWTDGRTVVVADGIHRPLRDGELIPGACGRRFLPRDRRKTVAVAIRHIVIALEATTGGDHKAGQEIPAPSA
jgi:hypothetical protein